MLLASSSSIMFIPTALYTLRTQYLFLLFLGVPLPSLFNSHYKSGQKASSTLDHESSQNYDFIIVGGGTAGLVVANRLSEKYRTLVVEAGGHPHPLSAVTMMAGGLMNNPDTDWMDQAVPQERACHAVRNNGTMLNRGKVLGGSSTLNFMMVMRGNPRDYDLWANETGDPQWSHENLLPFLKRLEDYHGEYSNEELHGKGGPLYIERPLDSPLYLQMKKAAAELGYRMKDPNAGQSEGFFRIDANSKQGRRHSTYSAYLEPILGRKNLSLRLHSHVTEILFDDNNRATGIRYHHKGKEYVAKCSKEVILSAGSLGSTKLLLLSGIGPKEHLESLDIPVRLDLPVGQNMEDHVITNLGPFLIDKELSVLPSRDFHPQNFRRYLEAGEGPLGTLAINGGAVLSSSLTTKEWPDILLVSQAIGLSPTAADELTYTFGYKEGLLNKYYENYIGMDSFNLVVTPGRPKSLGEVKLASKNPYEPPLVNPNYFDHPDDFKIIMEGVALALRVGLETQAFKELGVRLIPNLLPGCDHFKDNTEEGYWECYVKHMTTTMWHWTSVCRMGTGPENSVVDSNLRVHGTKGLRVIDASVMPHVTNANTHIPTIVIGEKGSDIILQAWK